MITLKELIELDACSDIYDTFKDAHPSGEATLLQTLDSNGLDGLLWYLDNTKQLSELQHADVDAWTRHQALKVSHLFKSDKKELIINFLKTGENRKAATVAAVEAAQAAREASQAERAASGAALAAARALAESAAWASSQAARGAALAAARAAGEAPLTVEAARAAARIAARDEQLTELRKMLERWER